MKDQIYYNAKKIVFIGEGPLFNHCVKSSLKNKKIFSNNLKNKNY